MFRVAPCFEFPVAPYFPVPCFSPVSDKLSLIRIHGPGNIMELGMIPVLNHHPETTKSPTTEVSPQMAKRFSLLSVFVGLLAFGLLRHTKGELPDDISLRDLPPVNFEWRGQSYRVDPYISAAVKLQALGKNKAIHILRIAALDPEQAETSIVVLCRMLFISKDEDDFRAPMLGGPHFLGGSRHADWPNSPIEIVDGVPFVIVRGYTLYGYAEPPTAYLEYCIKECDWSRFEFKARSQAAKSKAVQTLLESPKWRRAIEDTEKEYLSSQI
jgi:hypothetical protein